MKLRVASLQQYKSCILSNACRLSNPSTICNLSQFRIIIRFKQLSRTKFAESCSSRRSLWSQISATVFSSLHSSILRSTSFAGNVTLCSFLHLAMLIFSRQVWLAQHGRSSSSPQSDMDTCFKFWHLRNRRLLSFPHLSTIRFPHPSTVIFNIHHCLVWSAAGHMYDF